jgi:hypothetical protein
MGKEAPVGLLIGLLRNKFLHSHDSDRDDNASRRQAIRGFVTLPWPATGELSCLRIKQFFVPVAI